MESGGKEREIKDRGTISKTVAKNFPKLLTDTNYEPKNLLKDQIHTHPLEHKIQTTQAKGGARLSSSNLTRGGRRGAARPLPQDDRKPPHSLDVHRNTAKMINSMSWTFSSQFNVLMKKTFFSKAKGGNFLGGTAG